MFHKPSQATMDKHAARRKVERAERKVETVRRLRQAVADANTPEKAQFWQDVLDEDHPDAA